MLHVPQSTSRLFNLSTTPESFRRGLKEMGVGPAFPEVSGDQLPCLPDHLVLSFALGVGLRLAEIVDLDVGTVYSAVGQPESRIRIRAEITKGCRAADVFIPDALIGKLRRFWPWKLAHHEPLDPGARLFCNHGRRRISKRRVQIAHTV